MPAIITAIDCYCALATRLRFKYTYDLDPHALLLQVLVVAEAASGKSFTRPIVKSLMQPLKLRDQEMKRLEQAYPDLKKTSAKNKQLPEEPITDVRCLQTITKAKLVKRADMFIRKCALHCLIQPIFICLLLCTALAASCGREEKVTEKLADTFEKTFNCHVIITLES